MRPSRSVAAALTCVAILSSAAQAGPWGLARGEFYSELSGNFFSTRTYFRNPDEKRTSLDALFEQRSLTSHNEFGWRKNATLIVDVPFVSRTVVPNGASSLTSTGLGDLGIGLRFALHSGSLPVALEFGWSAPLGTNRRLFPGTSGSGGLDGAGLVTRSTQTLTDPATYFSQGLQSLSARLDVGGTAGHNAYWAAGGGVKTTFLTPDARALGSFFDAVMPFHEAFGLSFANVGGRGDRTADFATSSAELGIWLRPQLLVSGQFQGEWTMYEGGPYDRIVSPAPGNEAGELSVRRWLAGPRVTYRVDERMDVFVGSWHTPRGRNALHHDLYYCGIAWKKTSLDRLAGALGGTKAR